MDKLDQLIKQYPDANVFVRVDDNNNPCFEVKNWDNVFYDDMTILKSE